MQLSEGALSILKDPFNYSSIKAFHTHCSKRVLSNDWYYHGRIEFQNGNTGGEQRFDASDYATLLTQMKAFIEQLENNKGGLKNEL